MPSRGLLLAAALTLATCCQAAPANEQQQQQQQQQQEVAPQAQSNDYWLKRRAEFYNSTSFRLDEQQLELLGPRRLMFGRDSLIPSAHLPFWFDYQLFKFVFNKTTTGAAEQRRRHRAYLNTCVRVLKLRTLFRMLAGTEDSFITREADLFYWEKPPFNLNSSGQAKAKAKSPKPRESKEDQKLAKLDFSASFKAVQWEQSDEGDESPLARALRLVRLELGQVESRNQVEHYLKAFNEVDGSAIAAKLPYC